MTQVTFQRYAVVDDGMGGEKYEWVDHLTVEGTLDQLSSDEILAYDRINKIASHIFIIFEMIDVTEEDRMIFNNYIYNVTNVDNPMNLDRQLEITVEYTGKKVT